MRPAAVQAAHRFLALATITLFVAAAALFGIGVAKVAAAPVVVAVTG